MSRLTKKSFEEIAEQVNKLDNLRKKRRFSSSRLNLFMHEIIMLRFVEETSYATIALWLRTHKRIKITPQAIHQFIKKTTAEMQPTENSLLEIQEKFYENL